MQPSSAYLTTAFFLSFCILAAVARDPQLVRTGPGQRVEPRRAAAFRIENGRIVLTSDWTSFDHAGPRGGPFYYAYDCFESDSRVPATLVPSDNSPGCQSGTSEPGDRWQLDGFNNPFVSADLTTAPYARGVICEAVVHAWSWKVGAAEPDSDGDGRPDSPCFIAISTFESMDTAGCSDDGSTAIDGVIYDFSPLNSSDPYYYLALDLSGTGLFHTMPSDGVGGYQLLYFIGTEDGDPLILPEGIDSITQRGVAVQPMLWGTGDAEPLFDGRVGSQDEWQFDDINFDAEHQIPGECATYDFGVCPNPLGAMTGFLFQTQFPPCLCAGDLDEDGVVTLNDLTHLLIFFG